MKYTLTTLAMLTMLASHVGAATYTIDPTHTTVGFAVSHLGISETRGIFRNFEGWVEYDTEHPEAFALKGTIKAASIDTAVEMRDSHLRGPDFFDVERYPEITFVSERAELDGSRILVTGLFTLRGVTRSITLPVTVRGPVKDAFGKTRIGLFSEIVINRQDYGISWNRVLDTGELVIGNEVRVTIDAESILVE